MSESSSVGGGNGRDPFASYIKSLRTTYLSEKTEHTDRDAIKVLLQGLAPSGITVVPEPRQVARSAPDFKIRQNGQIVGYLEAKPLGTGLAELKRIANGEQIGRYKALSKNIVLTDYLNWIWIKGDSEQSRTLCDIDELEAYKTTPKQGDVKELGLLLHGFLSSPPQRIGRSSDLADELAVRTRFLRDFLSIELTRQQHASQGERLYGLFLAFKKQVSESISIAEFADAFAQTLSYGLFLSKLNANGHSLHLGNAKQFIPKSFRLIQELVGFIDELTCH